MPERNLRLAEELALPELGTELAQGGEMARGLEYIGDHGELTCSSALDDLIISATQKWSPALRRLHTCESQHIISPNDMQLVWH